MSASVDKQAILDFIALTKGRWSYQLVAERFGTTRSTIAGIVFRSRHARTEMVKSPSATTPNKLGTGYRASRYYPTYTASHYTGRS